MDCAACENPWASACIESPMLLSAVARNTSGSGLRVGQQSQMMCPDPPAEDCLLRTKLPSLCTKRYLPTREGSAIHSWCKMVFWELNVAVSLVLAGCLVGQQAGSVFVRIDSVAVELQQYLYLQVGRTRYCLTYCSVGGCKVVLV